jgi:hypothetical protein
MTAARPSATTGPASTPILCDMTNAPDTAEQRLADYRRLFADALIARERTVSGTRWRFRATEGTESLVRDLAAREQACCAFFSFSITVVGGEVLWDASVVDDDMARAILEEFHRLPDTLGEGAATLYDRMAAKGLRVYIDDGGGLRPATIDELGLTPAGDTDGARRPAGA